MQEIKEFILEHWFYIYGYIYIIDCIASVYMRIKDKAKENINVDMTNLNSTMESNKRIFKKLINPSFIILIVSLFWIYNGYKQNDVLEKTYFIVLFVSGFVLPFLFQTLISVDVYLEMKDKGKTKYDTNYLKEKAELKKLKIFLTALNCVEIFIVVLILKNHFL